MTAVRELIRQVAAAGGELVCTGGDGLKLRAPAPLPDALVNELRARKPDLIAALTAPVPMPLVMRDGRRLYRLPADRIGDPTLDATKLAAECRRRGVVLVADNRTLVAVLPRSEPVETVAKLQRYNVAVLGVLHRQSDERMDAPGAAERQ